ncbi:hypothetical protein HMPREF3293_00652, partial [Christensenella minuta]
MTAKGAVFRSRSFNLLLIIHGLDLSPQGIIWRLPFLLSAVPLI